MTRAYREQETERPACTDASTDDLSALPALYISSNLINFPVVLSSLISPASFSVHLTVSNTHISILPYMTVSQLKPELHLVAHGCRSVICCELVDLLFLVCNTRAQLSIIRPNHYIECINYNHMDFFARIC